MADSICINQLSKTYAGSKQAALDRLTLTVAAGEVYGFLGANGAGKSTTIRLLLNFLQPTKGSATILGKNISADSVAVKEHLGYLAGDVVLWPTATGEQIFAYLSKLQKKDCSLYLAELIERFEAEPSKQIRELSKGNRQKIGIIQALMHQPEVLILDEPTSGLDPLMQEVFYATIREAAERGAAVFVSSHNLAEAQRMCDRVGIIKKGKLVHEQSIKGDGDLVGITMRVTLATTKDATRLAKSARLNVVNVEGSTVTVKPTGTIAATLRELANFPIKNFSTDQLNLEDEFLEFYEREGA